MTSGTNILHLGMNGMNEWTTDSRRGRGRRTTNRCHQFAFVFLRFGQLYLFRATEYISHRHTSIFLLRPGQLMDKIYLLFGGGGDKGTASF